MSKQGKTWTVARATAPNHKTSPGMTMLGTSWFAIVLPALDPDSIIPSLLQLDLKTPNCCCTVCTKVTSPGSILHLFIFIVSKSESGTKQPILGHTSMFYLQGRLGIEYLAFSMFIVVVVVGSVSYELGNSPNTSSEIPCWTGTHTHIHTHTYTMSTIPPLYNLRLISCLY